MQERKKNECIVYRVIAQSCIVLYQSTKKKAAVNPKIKNRKKGSGRPPAPSLHLSISISSANRQSQIKKFCIQKVIGRGAGAGAPNQNNSSRFKLWVTDRRRKNQIYKTKTKTKAKERERGRGIEYKEGRKEGRAAFSRTGCAGRRAREADHMVDFEFLSATNSF